MDGLIRVAAGIEHADDLLADFAQALAAARKAPEPERSRARHQPAGSNNTAPAHGAMECNASGAPFAGTGLPLPPGVPPPGSGAADPLPGAALVGGSVLGCLLSDSAQMGGVTIRKAE